MSVIDPTHPLTEFIRRDRRYRLEAYEFIFDALRFAQEQHGLRKAEEEDDDDDEEHRHVSGQQLCQSIRKYAIDQYGMMAKCVLNTWGVYETGDFGEIVFNLIDLGQMRKTESDRREDFDDVFKFNDAFPQRFAMSPPKSRPKKERRP
jgi:uncharacterized repeat protein (TIGR04138 family)